MYRSALARRARWLLLGIAFGGVGAYAILSGFARRPLSPRDFWVFGAAVLRATPAHVRGSNPLETLRFGGEAFGSPAKMANLSADGRASTIPLPPRTARAANTAHAQRFVTFATRREMWEYLHATLPRSGWRYRDQFGSVHVLEHEDLILSVQSTFYVGTRVGELRINLWPRPRRSA